MIKDHLTHIDNYIQNLQKRRAALVAIESQVDELGLASDLCLDTLDFNNLSHFNVIRVIATFGGRWTKKINAEKIDYVRDEKIDDCLRIRCWAGEPPPSCRIVEEKVEVPEQVIPAHKKTIRKLVCNE